MVSFVRISALKWADLLAEFAMYVMMNYLTNVWNLKTTHAAGIINIWNGITPALAITFACFANGFMGHYYMLLISSIAYTIGLGFFSISTPPVLGPCSYYKEECIGHTQKVLFFVALPLTAIGMGGHLVSVDPFLDLQTKSEDKDEAKREHRSPWQVAGLFIVVVFNIAGGVALPYIKPWSIRFAIPAISMFVATLLFMSGSRGYKRGKKGQGNPLTIAVRVFISATLNFSKPFPDHKQLYNDEDAHSTRSLRCLDKAAIRLPEHGDSKKNWWLCSVREIEDTKTSVRMLPMWLTFIVIGIVLSTGNTYFLEQANQMDHKLGTMKVSIPIFHLFSKFLSFLFARIYSLLITKCKKRGPQLGIAIAMVFSVLCCMAAAKVETRRLHVIKDHDLVTKPDERIPMSIFWLLPQIVLLAAVDGIAKRSIIDFFKHQAPKSMKTYFVYLTKGVLGLGSMASVFSVTIVGKVSERNQMQNWFQATLNESRLDCYYWTLCALSATNLVIYAIVSFFYKYKESPDDGHHEEESQQMDMNLRDTANCCGGSLLMSVIVGIKWLFYQGHLV